MPTCANKACGKEFNETDDCYYHPGGPVFHDALKIPGCTVGKHSLVAIQQPAKAPESKPVASKPRDEAKVETKDTPRPEVFQMKDVKAEKEPEPVKIPEEELHDAKDAVIEAGQKCKRPSCGKPYHNESTREEECVYHSGAPVFHEGSKGIQDLNAGWSCCSRKVLEFDEFLKIKGCRKGKHRFTSGSSESGPVVVDCKRDWYQTPDKVNVSVFAKKVNKDESKVAFADQRLAVDIKFVDGSIHKFHTDLFQPIIPDQCSYEILSTKIEIILKKANGISWAVLEQKENVTSWTTFGISGGVGSVGSKEALIANDAPIHILK
ncbi:hypothetical protein HK103_000982 [Boothiomyces macroporosus]|uniref:Chord-domain-containing protein n=1 Tax=Boothiomyces macroporosus TaxID=261099 RepID=A0AAD5UKZ4_9FUNG|nr:hypothetical protein HK103_000982 [Boothiomyces macroporosus]